MRATSSGCRQPWADGLAPGLGEELALGLGEPGEAEGRADGDPEGAGEAEGRADGDGDGDGAGALEPDEAEPDEAEPDVPGEEGELGELGFSWVQAAMTTRSLTGSALPPTPLRSTK